MIAPKLIYINEPDPNSAMLLQKIDRVAQETHHTRENVIDIVSHWEGITYRDGIFSKKRANRTSIMNLDEILQKMNRPKDHLISYICSYLRTTYSNDSFVGHFQPKQIENVFRRYIIDYLLCPKCRNDITLMNIQESTITCQSCGHITNIA